MYTIPIFPLDTVLFPGAPLRLHIFEPRYRMMIRRCLEHQQAFGVALIVKGQEAGGELAQPARVACTARIAEIEALEDGGYNLTALGEDRVYIRQLNYDLPYLTGEVEWQLLQHAHSIPIQRGIRLLRPWIADYLRFLNLQDPVRQPDLSRVELPEDPHSMLYFAAALLQLPAVEKQPLLEAATADELLAQVLRLYRRETTLLAQVLTTSPAASRAAWLN